MDELIEFFLIITNLGDESLASFFVSAWWVGRTNRFVRPTIAFPKSVIIRIFSIISKVIVIYLG